METMTVVEFKNALRGQGVPRDNLALICPMCGTVQSASDLMGAGAGDSFENVEKYLGFSCVGRFTGAGAPPKKPNGGGCNWTLGGLFQTHKLEVVTDDGVHHPRFQVATPEQAKAHMKVAA